MANTLKFGNGQWAVKEGSTLAYNDENNNFKPLPFNFERDSRATVVNKDGLIETVGHNTPRIDYKDDSKGSLLLEPSRTNLATYSEDFSDSYWGTTSAIPTINDAISPDGTLNATKLNDSNSGSGSLVRLFGEINVLASSDVTFSCFLKKGTLSSAVLRTGGFTTPANGNSLFDLENGTVLVENIGHTARVENYGNGWYRCSITFTTDATDLNGNCVVGLANGTSQDVTVDGSSNIYIWGAMAEQGSYATSYIPTQGSIGTRYADTAPNQLDLTPLNIGNSYTFFLDVDLNNIDNNKIFSSINNSSSDLSFTLRNIIGGIRLYNNLDAIYPVSGIISSNNKFVLKIDGNSYKIFVQGSSLSGTLTTQRDLGYLNFYGQNTQLKINNFTIDNTALSDAECQALVN